MKDNSFQRKKILLLFCSSIIFDNEIVFDSQQTKQYRFGALIDLVINLAASWIFLVKWFYSAGLMFCKSSQRESSFVLKDHSLYHKSVFV